MAHIRHRVTLSEAETRILEDILDRGKHSAQKRKRARAMLLAHQGMTDPENAAISGMRVRSIEDMRKHFVEMGFELTLNGVPKKPRGKKITGADEARLIALACETKPDGHMSVTARVSNFSSWRRMKAGAELTSPNAKPEKTGPGKCVSWWMKIFRKPKK